MLKVIYFGANWCAPCKMFSPIVESVVGKVGVQYQKVDIDYSPELTQRYGISSVPTVIFEKNGQVVGRTGTTTPISLEKLIQKYQ
jgi:thioredoxin 1